MHTHLSLVALVVDALPIGSNAVVATFAGLVLLRRRRMLRRILNWIAAEARDGAPAQERARLA